MKQFLEMGLPTVAYVLFGSSISSTWHNALCIVVDFLQVVLQVCSRDLHDSDRGTEGLCILQGLVHVSSSLSKDIIPWRTFGWALQIERGRNGLNYLGSWPF